MSHEASNGSVDSRVPRPPREACGDGWDGDGSMESNGKLNPNFITDPTSRPGDAGDEVFAYDAEGRRFETRSGEGTKRSVIDHRNSTGYSQELDDLTREAGHEC